MTTYKDTDLREALRRKYANTPQLPSDFMNRMHKVAQPKKPHSSFVIRHSSFPYWAGIAAALLIAFLVWPESHKETTTQQEVKPIVAKAEPQPVPQPIVEETKEEVLTEAQPTPQLVREQRKAVKKHSDPIEEPVLAQAEPVIAESELKESNPEEDVPLIPAHKQALADIFLAEEALQVAYELQAQQEAIRAYASSITGEEMPGPIIAF